MTARLTRRKVPGSVFEFALVLVMALILLSLARELLMGSDQGCSAPVGNGVSVP